LGASGRRVDLTTPGLSECAGNLLHSVDQIDRGRWQQHHAAGRIAAAAERHLGLYFVKTRYAKL
jgi:hypothetical protein